MIDQELQSQDEIFMRRAIELAKMAESIGEVPVGAVIVLAGEIMGEGYNQPITTHDPTAHAEIVALRAAAVRLKNYRVVDSTIYVTLEPCTMCVGALIHARVARLVFGALEPKAGAIVSQAQLLSASYFNHRMNMRSGVLAENCQHQLSDFFRHRRAAIKQQKSLPE